VSIQDALTSPVARSFVVSAGALLVVVGIASAVFPEPFLSSDYPESPSSVRVDGAVMFVLGAFLCLPPRVGALGRPGIMRISLLLLMAAAPVLGAVRGMWDEPEVDGFAVVAILLLLVVGSGAPALAAVQVLAYRRASLKR
jgi:hypothetical protein